jgi:hypothetical protein
VEPDPDEEIFRQMEKHAEQMRIAAELMEGAIHVWEAFEIWHRFHSAGGATRP